MCRNGPNLAECARKDTGGVGVDFHVRPEKEQVVIGSVTILCAAAAYLVSRATTSIARTTRAPVKDAKDGVSAYAVSDYPVRDTRRTNDNDVNSDEENGTCEANGAGSFDDGDYE